MFAFVINHPESNRPLPAQSRLATNVRLRPAAPQSGLAEIHPSPQPTARRACPLPEQA
jgi:hypothetical protein